MGCWNKTCGLSNLPIFAGDIVYVVAMQQETYHNRCGTAALWKPLPMVFECQYNDYGGGENSEERIEYVLAAIRENIVDMPLGKNEYHDIAVSADILDEKLFFDAVSESRLFVNDQFRSGKSMIDYVMIRKDVVMSIMENWKFDHYNGSDFVQFKYRDIIDAIPGYVSILEADFNKMKSGIPDSLTSKYFNRGLRFLSIEHENSNLAAYWFGRAAMNVSYSSLLRPASIASQHLNEGNRKDLTVVIESAVTFKFIDSFMESTRKQWIPAGHEGSQSADFNAYQSLVDAMQTVITNEISQIDSEND